MALVAIAWMVGTPILAVNLVGNNVGSLNGSRYGLLARSLCPADLETLVDRLLQDLPSYANRVIVRSRLSPNSYKPPGYVPPQIILARQLEFEPFPLSSEDTLTENASQVFITTLERQYRGGKAVEIKQYHWLFFTKTENGWELVKIVSRFGTVADVRPLLPQDSEKSEIAEAIRLWLRDCRAKGEL